MSFNLAIGLFVTVVSLVIYWFKKKFSYWEDHGFDFVQPVFPQGNLKGVGYKVHMCQRLKEYYDEFKNKAKVVGMYFSIAPIALITNLDTLKYILVKDFSYFHDRGFYVNKEADPLTGHLFALEGKWLLFHQVCDCKPVQCSDDN